MFQFKNYPKMLHSFTSKLRYVEDTQKYLEYRYIGVSFTIFFGYGIQFIEKLNIFELFCVLFFKFNFHDFLGQFNECILKKTKNLP